MAYAFHFSQGRAESIRLAGKMFTDVNFSLNTMVKERFDGLLREFPWDYLRRVLEECTAQLEVDLNSGVVGFLLTSDRNFRKYAEMLQCGSAVEEEAAKFDDRIKKLAEDYLGGYHVYHEGRDNMLNGVEDSRFDPVIQARLTAVFTKCRDELITSHTKMFTEINDAIQNNHFVLPMLGAAGHLYGYAIGFCDVWLTTFIPKHVQVMQQMSDDAAARAQAAAGAAAAGAQNAGAAK